MVTNPERESHPAFRGYCFIEIGRRKRFSPAVSLWVSLIGWDGRWILVSGAKWTLKYFLVLWLCECGIWCVDTLYVNILLVLVMWHKDELDVLQKCICPGFVKMRVSMPCAFHLLSSSSSLVLFKAFHPCSGPASVCLERREVCSTWVIFHVNLAQTQARNSNWALRTSSEVARNAEWP